MNKELLEVLKRAERDLAAYQYNNAPSNEWISETRNLLLDQINKKSGQI